MDASQIFRGELVRLAAINPDTDAEALARWSQDSEFDRLLNSEAALPFVAKRVTEEIEREEVRNDHYVFSIRTLSDDRLIGWISLEGIQWSHSTSWVGIGIGERDCWGKGYGTDAMRVLLRFAFEELDLFRVNLNVFEYNTRGIRSYEKAGFTVEGRARRYLNRNGRRWDIVYMGILRQEWERVEEAKRQRGNKAMRQ
jgi:RimJ/RimL family protein N-acetyltransferase